jgi:hypothetical protein
MIGNECVTAVWYSGNPKRSVGAANRTVRVVANTYVSKHPWVGIGPDAYKDFRATGIPQRA